jgi:ABC-type bacteriocin/lantibiotic exporter with double-glycine peptidase domain
VKPFLVYNALRLALLISSFVVVAGVWSLFSDEVPLFWAAVVALVLSGIASWFLLARPREAAAMWIQGRAERASAAFEARKAQDDED